MEALLAHTIEHEWFMKLILNDQLESEFTLNALVRRELWRTVGIYCRRQSGL